jgi:tRNA dimethylallyltransferase
MDKNNTKKIISISGPTAVGKTSYAIELALKHHTEIISFDSRQVYQELNIGVARPSLEELNTVPHHFIANKSIHESFTVNDYEKEALILIQKLFEEKDTIVLCGGTGLYLNAIRFGLDDMPEISNEIRTKVDAEIASQPIETIQENVKKIDPESYESMDVFNTRRLQRVLEIFYATGKKWSDFKSFEPKKRPFQVENIILNRSREILYQRIDQRVEQMIAMGLEQEVEQLLPYFHLNALNTVGYKEWLPFFENQLSKDKVIDKIKQHSRNYAKRQITWFKKYGAQDTWLEI